MARRDPGSSAGSLRNRAGVAIFAGDGSPVTQGLAMGLDGEVAAADLDAVPLLLTTQERARQTIGYAADYGGSLDVILDDAN